MGDKFNINFNCNSILDSRLLSAIKNRKRIITGLSEILLVTESKEKGNAIINAGFALEQGKEIFAIPSPINSLYQGTNDIIKNGGNLLNSIDDILNSRGI